MPLRFSFQGGWALIDLSLAADDEASGCWTDGMSACLPVILLKGGADRVMAPRVALLHADHPDRVASSLGFVFRWLGIGQGDSVTLWTVEECWDSARQALRTAATQAGATLIERLYARGAVSQECGLRRIDEATYDELDEEQRQRAGRIAQGAAYWQVMTHDEVQALPPGTLDESSDLRDAITYRGSSLRDADDAGFVFAIRDGYYDPPSTAVPPDVDAADVPVFEFYDRD